MSETKFTKGKWILNEKSCEVVSENDCSKNGGIDIITQCYCGFNVENTIEEAMANAKLISAAPDMYFALENLLSELEDCSLPSSMNFYIHNAKVALNKAVRL